MTQQDRFKRALQALRDWHTDSLKARDYDAPGGGGGKPGSRVLRSQFYPGLRNAVESWDAAERHHDPELAREAVIYRLEAEYQALSKRPTRIETFRDAWGKTRYRVIAAEAQA